MCDKDTCNDASCCGECEPWNCLEQQINDALATKEGQLQGYVDEAKDAAAESKASAEASAQSAQSAAESKEFRDEAETAASTAVAAESVVIGVANTLQDTADKLGQVADELGIAIAGIAVSSWFYTTVSENQTVIPVPADKNAVDVQSIYIEGTRQSPFRGFEFDKTNMTITLAEPLPLGLEIEIVLGTYNSDNPNDFAHTLASDNGAGLVGTVSSFTVQDELDANSGSFQDGAKLLYKNNRIIDRSSNPAQLYIWDGAFPKTVAAGSTPETTGGVGLGAWLSVGDATAREWVSENFQSLYFKKSPGSFTTGGSATFNQSALLNVADGMYYMPKTGSITAAAGSSPDSLWICVGLMSQYELGDLRNFKGVGDGIANDTQAFRLAMFYANQFKSRVIVPGGYTFICDKMKFTGISGVTIEGPGCIKMISGRTGAFYYADGAQLMFINSYDLKIIGVEFDGNRAGSPSYTGANHGIQFGTGDGDYRSNNGGDVKTNRNILISGCYFHDQGGYNTGIDKFGDGIYLFAVDGAVIENNYFKDVGRWAVAASDCFNISIVKNRHDCSKAGTVALGFVDIENESTDNVNGSYSKNITIADNQLLGFGQILVGAGNNSENNLGAQHYLRNVVITGNSLLIESNTHENPSYITNLIFIGVAPFCNVAPTTSAQSIDNSNIVIANNTLKCYIESNLAIGVGINAQGSGFSNGVFNNVRGIQFKNNVISGFNKGIQASGSQASNGYTFINVLIGGNSIDCSGITNSIGVRLAATQLVGALIHNNSIRGATTRGFSIEDGTSVGAIDSYVMVSDNEVTGPQGTNYFAYVYRASFQGNGSRGGALMLDATVMNMDKDYGNTWNSLKRTIPSITIPNGAQRAYGGIDVGSQTRFGYTVDAAPPFHMGQATFMAYMTEPGFAMMVVMNLTGGQINRASAEWTIRVEKK